MGIWRSDYNYIAAKCFGSLRYASSIISISRFVLRHTIILRWKMFKYYAAYYLRQWLSLDKGFVDGFKKDIGVGSLQDMLTKYKAIRTFRDEKEKEKKQGAARLNELGKRLHEQQPGEDVSKYIEEAQCALRGYYTDNDILSAITKVAWMRWQGAIVIYDSRVVRALKRLRREYRDPKYKFSLNSYSGFYQAWMHHFEKHDIQDQLSAACEWLPTSDYAKRLAAQRGPREEQVREWASEQWFRVRIVDMVLFDKGAKGKPSEPSPMQRAELLGVNETAS